MPYPAAIAQIDQEQERVGRPFPSGLRERLLVSNGGSLFVGAEEWTLFPVWDPTTRRSAGRSSGHIAHETSALYEGLADVLVPGLVALAENGAGDYLMIDRSSRPLIWRHETNALEQVDVDWKRDRPSAKRSSPRGEAIARIASALVSMSTRPNATVVIEAPNTGIYMQIESSPEGVVGEAVGASNLSTLTAYQMGSTMQSKLPGLGWRQPVDPAIDHGNWTHVWQSSEWNPASAARLVVRTLTEVYGLEPWALAVTIGSDSASPHGIARAPSLRDVTHVSSPPDFDPELWITADGYEGRLYLLGNPRTHRGRMYAWSDSLQLGTNVSKYQITDSSEASRRWIEGYLHGSEPTPAEYLGIDEQAEAALADDDPAFDRWRARLAEYYATGATQTLPPLPSNPIAEDVTFQHIPWTWAGGQVWVWKDRAWVVADPQPALEGGTELLAGTDCAARGYHEMSGGDERYVWCIDCGRAEELIG